MINILPHVVHFPCDRQSDRDIFKNLPVHLSNQANNILSVGSNNPLCGSPLSSCGSGMLGSCLLRPANCSPSRDFGIDNGGVTGLLCSTRSIQVMLLKNLLYCHCVTSGRLPTDSKPISFRQEQMRRKIELRLIHAIRTYRHVQRPFQPSSPNYTSFFCGNICAKYTC